MIQDIKLTNNTEEIETPTNIVNAKTEILKYKILPTQKALIYNGALFQLWLKDSSNDNLPNDSDVYVSVQNKDLSKKEEIYSSRLLPFNSANQYTKDEQLSIDLKKDKLLTEFEWVIVELVSSVAIDWTKSNFALAIKKITTD